MSQLEQLRSGLDIQLRQMEKTKREANLAMIKKLDGLLEQRKYAVLQWEKLVGGAKTETGRQIGAMIDKFCGCVHVQKNFTAYEEGLARKALMVSENQVNT